MAAAAAAGMDSLVVRYYQTDDPTERAIIESVLEKALEIAGEIRDDQAKRIIQALDEAMGGGSKSSGKGRRRRTR